MVTVIRSDFPGFHSVIEVSHLTVEGRYLVVRVIVDDSPSYLPNVYATVDRREKCQVFLSLVTEG